MDDDAVGYEIMSFVINSHIVEFIVDRFNAFDFSNPVGNEATLIAELIRELLKSRKALSYPNPTRIRV